MAAISTGASALAFAGFALEGIKFIYNATSGFNHAAREVAALTSTITNLQKTLTLIHDSRALTEQGIDAARMKDLLDACNRDIAAILEDLRKLQSGSAEPKLLQTWKRAKATLEEERLGLMRTKLGQHCDLLQLEFSHLQSTFTLDCRDGIRGLQDTAAAESLRVSTLVQNVQMVGSSINDQSDQIQILQDTATAGSSRISTLIQDVKSIKSSMEGQMQNMTQSTTSTIEKHAVISSSELNTISIAVKALQDQISTLPDQVAIAQRASELSQEHLGPRSNNLNAMNEVLELSSSLERLRKIGSCDPRTFHGEEADAIIEDLECLLATLSQTEKDARLSLLIPRQKRNVSGSSITSREFKRIRGLVSVATSVAINQGPTRSCVVGSEKIVQQQKAQEIVLRDYTMTVTMNKRRLQRRSSHNARQHSISSQYDEEFYATVKVIIDDAKSPAVIMAYIRQIQLQNGFASWHPTVSVGRILPDDSPMFEIVSGGSVDELRKFLARGEGTLRDRDRYGVPLLQYAVSMNKERIDLNMCSFLIEHGADIDEVTTLPEHEEGPYGLYDGTPLFAATYTNSPDAEGRIALIKLLLATGADPTLEGHQTVSPLTACANRNEEDILILFVDNPLPFVDLNEHEYADNPILLQVAMDADNDDGRAPLDQLLRRGADISARGELGRNCLRLLLGLEDYGGEEENDKPLPIAKPLHESLALLVGNGADVSNVDDEGISVSAYAYGHYNHEYWCAYAGDLWDAVLSQYGHDIRQMRLGFHRLAFYRYGNRPAGLWDWLRDEQFKYDRNDFELLWKGREVQCPYYHDPPVWCPYSTLDSGECPYGGTGHVCPGPQGVPEQVPCRCIRCVPESGNDSDYVDRSDNEDAYDEDVSENKHMSRYGNAIEEKKHQIFRERIQEVDEHETDDMYGGDNSTVGDRPRES